MLENTPGFSLCLTLIDFFLFLTFIDSVDGKKLDVTKFKMNA